MVAVLGSIYEAVMSLGLEVDHHGSDLYVKDCEQTRQLVKEYDCSMVTSFLNLEDQETWLYIPTMYDPYWDNKQE